MQTAAQRVDRERLFPGDSEMAGRMRALDWSKTDLGPPERWPENLCVAIRLCLTSRFSILLWWGHRLTVLYNDAHLPFLGPAKHPRVLGRPGRECWGEVWDTIGPMLDGVVTTGRATWSEDMELMYDRTLPKEEVFVTFTYAPILAADGRTVDGVFCPCAETTAQVVGSRRLEALRKLGIRVAAESRTVEDACRRAAAVLGEHTRDIPFAAIYVTDGRPDQATLTATVLPPGEHRLPPSVSTSEGGSPPAWPLAMVLRTRRAVDCSDLPARGIRLRGVPWPEDVRDAIVLPIHGAQDQLAGLLVLGLSPRRPIDAHYRTFCELVAGHIATAIADARAYEEEKRRAEALAELDRAKTAFFSNVSHEFRTPLTLMLGPVEDALADTLEPLPAGQRERLQAVHRSSLRLLKLVNTLLDFSRIEAGRVQAVYEATDLAGLTAELASNFRSVCEKAGVRLVVDCPPLPEPVYVDRDMWEKIVLNLVSNAFKFTFEGRIEVRLCARGEAAELEVRDTGMGISADELPRIFERFHRVEGARGRTHEGTGIGLALVQELARLHGGLVRAASEFGKGSTFTVSIPLGAAHLPAERIGESRRPPSTSMGAGPYVEEVLRWLPDQDARPPFAGGAGSAREAFSPELPAGPAPSTDASGGAVPRRPRILWADDNADMRDYVRRLLGTQYEVEAVADGEAALAAAQTRTPDLVLTDVMMPRLDGFGLLRALRADPRTHTTPVILLSARAGEESRVEGLGAGADDYLVKPFSARELLARVRACVQLKRLREEAAGREQALLAEAQAARQRLEAVLQSISDGFIALDYDWRYTALNDRACESMGMRREEILGRRIWDLYPDTIGTPFEAKLLHAVAHQTTTVFEFFYPARNRWFENRAYPAPGGLSIFFAEITDRKLSEESLRESEAKFRALAENVPSLVWTCTLDQQCDYANPQFMRYTGLSESELLGDWRLHSIHPDDLAAMFSAWERSAASGEPAEFEARVRRHDGAWRWFQIRAAPIRDERGQYVKWFGTNTDIDDLKRAQAAMREAKESAENANRVKDEFLANISHELRTPLTSILLWSQILESGRLPPGEQAKAIGAIRQSARGQQQLVEDLLDVSRMLAGEIRIDAREIELGPLVQAAVTMVRPAAEAKQLRIELSLDSRAGRVRADAGRIQQVVLNLLNNAVKFTPDGGRVNVRVRRDGGLVEIEVSDTGQGIGPDFVPHVFERFRQADGSTARRHGGLGLGLPIARELAELHGGTIRAASPGKGRGATFTVELPAAPAPEELPAANPSSNPAEAEGRRFGRSPILSGIRALVVEDDPTSREVIQYLLEECEAEVTAIGTAAEALSEFQGSLRARRFDVVLSDLGLPEMSGYELMRQIRAMERQAGKAPPTPAIALTAYARDQDRAGALAAGFGRYLVKPVVALDLVRTVAECAGRSAGVSE